jgi:hypothetical protein
VVDHPWQRRALWRRRTSGWDQRQVGCPSRLAPAAGTDVLQQLLSRDFQGAVARSRQLACIFAEVINRDGSLRLRSNHSSTGRRHNRILTHRSGSRDGGFT